MPGEVPSAGADTCSREVERLSGGIPNSSSVVYRTDRRRAGGHCAPIELNPPSAPAAHDMSQISLGDHDRDTPRAMIQVARGSHPDL